MRLRGRTLTKLRDCMSTTPSTRVHSETLSQRIANTTSQTELIFSPEVCNRRVFSAFLTGAQTLPSNVTVLSLNCPTSLPLSFSRFSYKQNLLRAHFNPIKSSIILFRYVNGTCCFISSVYATTDSKLAPFLLSSC